MSIGIHHLDTGDNVLHLTAISSRIHIHRTAYSTGNPGSKLKTGQRIIPCQSADSHQLCPGLGCYHITINCYPIHIVHYIDYHAPVASIRHKQITAITKDKIRYLTFPTKFYNPHNLICIRRTRKIVGRTAHPEGSVCAHHLICACILLSGYLSNTVQYI